MDSAAAFLNRLGRRNTVLLLIAVVIAAILIAISCVLFTFYISREATEEATQDLTEISLGVADTVNARMEGVMNTVSSVGLTYVDPEEAGMDHQHYLSQKRESLGFVNLAMVNAEGKGVDADGTSVDLSGLPGVKAALAGQKTLSSTEPGSESPAALLYYAVPMTNGGQDVIGAVVAFNAPFKMRSYLNVESFGGEGYSELINLEGDYVVASDNKNSPGKPTNFFAMVKERGSVSSEGSLDAMKADVAEGRSGILEYELDGTDMIVNYRPLQQEGIYLMSAVPTGVAHARADALSTTAILVNVLIVGILAVLILFILFVNRRQRRHLEEIAFVDSVTGGHNKAWFILEAGGRITQAPPSTYTLISVDVQKFKLINDTFGTDKGDETLRHIYSKLDGRFGNDGLVCRYTADQFSMLIDTMSTEAILQKIDQVCDDINAFNEESAEKYYLTLSFGVVEIDDPELPLTLIQDRADTARKNRLESISTPLYTCVFYSDLERQRMLEEKEMENSMEGALKNGEFIMYLQPKVGLEKHCVVGAEALVRWISPSKGMLSPDRFIPLFEKNGFVVDIDICMFEQACSALRSWIDAGRMPVPISVNFSRAHFSRTDFLAPYKEICDRYGVPPELLEFEFTESLVFEDLEMVQSAIEQIHSAGFHCSIDDFGSGYSSFNMLKDVTADVLKIDRVFFTHEESNDRERAIVESVVMLAKSLHMTTIAEGVEHESTLEYLREIGCDAVQGYVFSKPLPLKEFEAFSLSPCS